ncbi:LLM class oxidoreductase [Robbsia sp. KACC 23696]|uniref:LLM class oxidoreductase n=1 Tax=Robbsia sp. KACC 23696 TaxID=3149231 RepID=UPI00325A5E6A
MQTNDPTQHAGFRRIFAENRLTIGFIAPLEPYPDTPGPTLRNHEAVIKHADDIGIAGYWLRDVPFYDPSFGDVGQVLDPFVYAGWLAAITRNMAIGTAGIVVPLREPIATAKQIATLDNMTGGRFIPGMASGDRPVEYPAFGEDFDNRAERYREAIRLTRTVLTDDFPVHATQHYGELVGAIDLVPKPSSPFLPLISIGRAGQTKEWIAEHMDGWIWHGRDATKLDYVVPQWRALTASRGFKPYGYGTWFDLLKDPDAPIEPGQILRGGRHALIELWKRQEHVGVNHVVLNLKPSQRPAEDVLDEMGTHILPLFPTHVSV